MARSQQRGPQALALRQQRGPAPTTVRTQGRPVPDRGAARRQRTPREPEGLPRRLRDAQGQWAVEANPFSQDGRRTPDQKPRTGIENLTRYALLRAGIAFVEQQQLGPYWPDYILPEYQAIIEVDGAYWHGSVVAKAHDAKKDRYYAQRGYRVFRFDEDSVKRDADRLVHALLLALDAEVDAVQASVGGGLSR